MITYKLNHTPEDGFNTFGISAFCGKKLIKSVSGISESFREMTELVEMCNELELNSASLTTSSKIILLISHFNLQRL